ncbi:asparaginase [Salibacterium halotolerans]|uniref:asparaginase n=1 Tax=Salibacterium halotolerans TaxID=1884432 RepID=A0A1I5Q2X2_9BACI|nr:asparaginase [Salibacterium halotolerans]SFP40549.1 L-asparaginase [Salibacterium halotolerans]
MKTIVILHTGGTIAMQKDAGNGGITTGEKNPLQQSQIPAAGTHHIISEELMHLPSPHMTPADMVSLYHSMNDRIRRFHADGVVITHGTDTMEETAFLLDLFHESSLPVVLTGAMRSGSDLSPDGPLNLAAAVHTAASDQAYGAGVLVVMNEEIHAASDVMKMHTSNAAAFQSPGSGPLGRAVNNQIQFNHRPVPKRTFQVGPMDKKVLLLKTYTGMEQEILSHLFSLPLDGVVLEGMGIGNIPPAVAALVHSLLERGVPVVLTSRCPGGIVQDVYSYEGGGRRLKEAGVLFTEGLSGPKARLLLTAALESCGSTEELRQCFEAR